MNPLVIVAAILIGSGFTMMFWGFAHAIDKEIIRQKSQKSRDLDYSEAFELLKDGEKERRKSEINKTGMKKIDTLINTLTALQLADDRPAVDRICESLIQNLREVQQEHDAELEEVRVIARGMQAKSEECENERRTAEAKVTELEGQLRAMSDLANSAMADAQKWQNAYLKLRVETPIVQKTDVTWNMPDGAIIMSQQAETALKAQEDRTPRNGYHKYHIKYYNYGDHRWHETELWCRGVKDVGDWVLGVCGGGVPVYDCKVVA